jgi:hypothetical protein
MQPMTRLRMHSAFVFWGGRAGSRDFSLLFPMCSHHIHTRFPPGSQRAPQVPRLFPTAPQFYPTQSCIPMYTNWKVGDHIRFYLVTWGPKRCFYWGVPYLPKYWRWVNQSGTFQNIFVFCLSIPLSPTVSRAIDSNGPSRDWQEK